MSFVPGRRTPTPVLGLYSVKSMSVVVLSELKVRPDPTGVVSVVEETEGTGPGTGVSL